MDHARRPLNPNFVLNQPRFKDASILVARRNFGCGSSREHAPWALLDAGFRCVIAPSFADIFFNNCYKNGMLPVVLPEAEMDRLFYDVASFPGFRLIVDLPNQQVSTIDRSRTAPFEIDAFRKRCLLNGLDEIGLTLGYAEAIRAFEARRREQQPWLFS
jgi:3-isopropylmalate/(R)-2-methylmalate dehydratase small subunit